MHPPAVPYQAYKSKRHSRTASALPLAPNVRPPSSVSNDSAPRPHPGDWDTEKDSSEYQPLLLDLVPPSQKELPRPPSMNGAPLHVSSDLPLTEPDPPAKPPTINARNKQVEPPSPVPSPSCSSAPLPPVGTTTPKRASTFRRLQPRQSASRAPLHSSPLRPPEAQSRSSSAASSITRQLDQSPPPPHSPPLHSRVASISSVISDHKFQSNGPSPSHTPNPSPRVPVSTLTVTQPPSGPGTIQPVPQSSTMLVPAQPSPTSLSFVSPSLSPSPIASTPLSVVRRSSAPYRPGFQPRGVCSPRTDEFLEARKAKNDATRIERTKLERRFEKLVNLHFPIESSESKEVKKVAMERRRSSIFDLDLDDLKNMDASDIWKGVVQSQALQGAKGDIRAAEQRIASWQEDSAVSKCPLCNASFHPLTNRKHHCRLCGQIICSLPVKRLQRPEPCSLLFIVDSKTRQIEEVGEGVDYGVKRTGSARKDNSKGKKKDETLADDEKFLKGVRVCRSCKPILSREQFYQEASRIPPLVRLYEAFISLEKEVEEALPQFHELLLTLNSDSSRNKEATAARKRILDGFASYDALSKRIHKIPCTPGSSQDRVQLAIRARAELFLQKNMFPLQTLPKAKKQGSTSDPATPLVDPDSELAHALQPLLEQECLLESFVGEAMAHRKFEDAKTLKASLKEIRAEIDRMLENGSAQAGVVTG